MEISNALNKFILFVNSILNKPGMFLVNNVEDLHLVLFGYCVASGVETEQFLSRFRKFVNDEFESKSDYDWARVIRFHSGGDKSSLDLFKIQFEKFLEIEWK